MPFPQATTRQNHGMNAACERSGALMNEGKVDLLISGHTHACAVMQPVEGRHNYPIVLGGGPAEQSRTAIRVGAGRDRLPAAILRPGGCRRSLNRSHSPELIRLRNSAARGGTEMAQLPP
jgi:hypothetical protein